MVKDVYESFCKEFCISKLRTNTVYQTGYKKYKKILKNTIIGLMNGIDRHAWEYIYIKIQYVTRDHNSMTKVTKNTNDK